MINKNKTYILAAICLVTMLLTPGIIGSTNIVEVPTMCQMECERGFPIRINYRSGNIWASSQEITNVDIMSTLHLYLRPFGDDIQFNLTVKIKESIDDDIILFEGSMDPLEFTYDGQFHWYKFDTNCLDLDPTEKYVIVVEPEDGVITTNNYGYEWGFITRDVLYDLDFSYTPNGETWRTLPFEHTFVVFGTILEVPDDKIVEQTSYTRGFPIRMLTSGNWSLAQGFTDFSRLDEFQLLLKKHNDATFNLSIGISSDIFYNNMLIYKTSLSPDDMPTDEQFHWYIFNTNELELDHTHQYYIIVAPEDDSIWLNNHCYEWAWIPSNIYPEYNLWYNTEYPSLLNWCYIGYESAFKLYGEGI